MLSNVSIIDLQAVQVGANANKSGKRWRRSWPSNGSARLTRNAGMPIHNLMAPFGGRRGLHPRIHGGSPP